MQIHANRIIRVIHTRRRCISPLLLNSRLEILDLYHANIHRAHNVQIELDIRITNDFLRQILVHLSDRQHAILLLRQHDQLLHTITALFAFFQRIQIFQSTRLASLFLRLIENLTQTRLTRQATQRSILVVTRDSLFFKTVIIEIDRLQHPLMLRLVIELTADRFRILEILAQQILITLQTITAAELILLGQLLNLCIGHAANDFITHITIHLTKTRHFGFGNDSLRLATTTPRLLLHRRSHLLNHLLSLTLTRLLHLLLLNRHLGHLLHGLLLLSASRHLLLRHLCLRNSLLHLLLCLGTRLFSFRHIQLLQ